MIVQLYRHNSGVDGWDHTVEFAHQFSTRDKALAWLTAYGYTHPCTYDKNRFEHQDVNQRHCMGQISYELREVGDLDPEPAPDVAAEMPLDVALARLRTFRDEEQEWANEYFVSARRPLHKNCKTDHRPGTLRSAEEHKRNADALSRVLREFEGR